MMSFGQESKTNTYTIRKHQDREMDKIPLNPCTSIFKSNILETKYQESLIQSPQGSLSSQFKYNRRVFSVLHLSLMGLMFFQASLAGLTKLMIIRAITLILIFSLFLIAACITKNKLVLVKFLYKFIGLISMIVLLINDSRLFYSEEQESYLNTLIFIFLVGRSLRLLVFQNFFFMFVVYLVSILGFSLILILDGQSDQHALIQLLILAIFVIYELFQIYLTEKRSRQLFYRISVQQKLSKDWKSQKMNASSEQLIKLQSQQLVKILTKVNQKLKSVKQGVMSPDLKDQLSQSAVLVNRVKNSIKDGALHDPVYLQQQGSCSNQFLIHQGFFNATLHTKTTKISTHMNTNKAVNFSIFSDIWYQPIEKLLQNIGIDWNFDMWFIQQTVHKTVQLIGSYFTLKWKLDEIFQISPQTIKNYFKALQNLYLDNPFHNACHAADVFHMFTFFFQQSNKWLNQPALDSLSIIIATLGHDVNHPAYTNNFLINKHSSLAIQYNDISVLQNMHCATIYQIMRAPGCGILGSLSAKDWMEARKMIIQMVLSTDPSKHFQLIGKFRLKVNDLDLEKVDDKALVYQIGLKCADIGHTAKNLQLHVQ